MCLAKEDFDRVVTTYDDSVRGYFDAERARILGEAMNIQPPSPPGSDCDAHAAPSAQVCRPPLDSVVGWVWKWVGRFGLVANID